MKSRYIMLLAATLSLAATAGINTSRLHISELTVEKSEKAMTVNMILDPAEFRVGSDNYVLLTPAIAGESDTLRLPSVKVAGRTAWFHEKRNSKDGVTLLRAGKGDACPYSVTVPYGSWMEVSRVIVISDTLSECNCNPPLSEAIPVCDLNFSKKEFDPKGLLNYVAPRDTADKVYSLAGRANVIFKVNRTDINWSYRSNLEELNKIMKTINVVKDNPDASVERILLTGYASPEGSYSNNVRLAKGRTEVVKRYVIDQSHFPERIFSTSYVPEDWGGLREWLAGSSLPDKDAMIGFIDDGSVPVEKKNDLFRKKFPKEYAFLLENVYPQLRHTDYEIIYKIRRYYDPDEIARVLKENPRNLSLNELFLLANKYEQGSPEYDEVFLTAARLFPDSEVANLNAAYSSINRGDMENARYFLSRLGDGGEASYARGIFLAKEGDYAGALEMLRKAESAGIEKAAEAIRMVEALMKPVEPVRIL